MKLSIADNVHLVEPGDFEPSEHWYPRVLNSNLHPLVNYFLNLTNAQIASRYTRLHPRVNGEKLLEILSYKPFYFKWSGTDMMHVMNSLGQHKLIIIETNSCPSGQKSMPLQNLNMEQGGYQKLIDLTFKPAVLKHHETGALAALYDKNPMENIGYASTIADSFNEPVYLVKFDQDDNTPSAKFEDNKLFVKGEDEEWIPIRAAFRYVTQQPHNRIPVNSKTLLLNPIEACLAGGRNKSEASLAYDIFNTNHEPFGLQIEKPETYVGVSWEDLPKYYQKLKNSMVIKVPEGNAGQGVYTITSEKEFEKAWNELAPQKDVANYVVQQLIYSNYIDGVDEKNGFFHVGSIPDRKDRSYAFDIRFMMHHTPKGLRPLAAYSRRARLPLNKPLPDGADSWDLYGTNLSVKEENGWSYDDARLIPYDIHNFGQLGLGVDELVQGFVLSCMATYAIDQHALNTFNNK
ncbi:MAG: hypothetical protein LAT76_02835 [Schleiferiaceae bacterium]|nr:hypothetical protein [Schleiferiaceae bacterium]